MLNGLQIAEAIIDGEIVIDPYHAEQMQPASYDVRLSGHWLAWMPWVDGHDNHQILTGEQSVEQLALMHPFTQDTYFLRPGGMVLASTMEYLKVGYSHVARIEGRSSPARMGLTAHITAGFCDPGYEGWPTLEIVNLGPCVIVLKKGMSIAQFAFDKLDSPVPSVHAYHGKYGDASRYPQASRMTW